MNAALLALQLVTTAAALVVAWRAIMVVNGMAHRHRGSQPFWAWLGFGLGYVLVACAAFGSLPVIWANPLELGYVVWTIGSAALICCDRRRRGGKLGDADRAAIAMIIAGKHRPANDPQQIVQFDTFAHGCGFRGQTLGGVPLCRHPARGPLAACAHDQCPVMNPIQKQGAA
jgi:hypothetical protein